MVMRREQVASKLRAKIRWGIAGVFILLAVAAGFDAPGVANRGIDLLNRYVALGLPHIQGKPFRLGLDLQGGTQLSYRADVGAVPEADRGAAVEGVRDVIERRVNAFGVGEPNIQTTKVGEEHRIVVELPGVSEVSTAIAMIGETPILEFREANDAPARELTKDEEKQLADFNAEAEKKAGELLKNVQGGADVAAVAKESSEDEQSKNNGGYLGFIGKNTALVSFYEWAKTAKDGDVSPKVLRTVDGFNVVKRAGERDGALEARASHILICYLGAARCEGPPYTKAEAKAEAERIFKEANADNFAALAKQYSADASNKDAGGDLGFFPKGAMVPPFDAAIFNAKVGEIVGPVETEFGFHIIYKTAEEISKEYELSRILVRGKSAADFVPPEDPWKATGLSGKQLERSEVVQDQTTGAVQVSLRFNSEGKQLFQEITTRNVGKQVAIFLDGAPISVPTVQQPILEGQAIISGNFTFADARLLTQRLNAGTLPVPVELIGQETLGATLGNESIAKSLKAGLVGFLLVILFMTLYYRVPGFISACALVIYTTVSLAIFKLFGVTLTLAGIAGFILSIGAAVDANVLIFERLKEELRAGKNLRTAVEEGFLRAWPSIRDSHLSTLISCLLLLWFGVSFVKGFAVTLAIGVLMSLFSAVTVSRIFLRFVVPWFPEYANRLFLGAKRVKHEA